MTTETQTAFPAEGNSAILAVRQALSDILASVGGDVEQPQELARRFGLDKTLTWRIARMLREEDAWEAITHIPRRPSIKIFAKTMAKHGAPAQRLEELERGMEEFDRFVSGFSGDRETLEAMASGTMKRQTAERRMEAFRRSGFQANAAVWGIRARLHLAMSILTPGREEGMLQAGMMSGFVDMFRLRTNVPWAVSLAIAWDREGKLDDSQHGSPLALDPEGLVDGVPMIPRFCSTPRPVLRRVSASGGSSRFELTDGPVGSNASTSVFVGWKWPKELSMYETFPGEIGEHGTHLWTPTELAISDLFVHRSLTFVNRPVVRVYSDLPGGPKYPTEGKDAGRLPLPEDVIDLGEGPPNTSMPEYRQYREMAEFAVGQMGFKIGDFRGYRFRLKYPPIPTMAVIQHPLAKRA